MRDPEAKRRRRDERAKRKAYRQKWHDSHLAWTRHARAIATVDGWLAQVGISVQAYLASVGSVRFAPFARWPR